MNLAQHFQAATSTGLENNDALVGDASLEAAVAGVIETGYEVDEANRVASEMQDVADSLESYREALTLSQESGNIDQTAASWMLAAGEAITSRVGVSLNSVSVESFGNPSDASDAVELVSLEAADLWRKLVQAIKDMIARARTALKGLWVKLTDSGAKLAKKGEALAKKARDTKGSPEEKTFEASFLDKVHVDGKAPKASELVSKVKYLDTLAKNIYDASESDIKKAGSSFKEVVQASTGEKSFDPAAFIGLMQNVHRGIGISNNGPSHLAVSDGTVNSSDELLGGKVIFVSAPNAAGDLSKAVQQFKIGMGNIAEKKEVDSKGDVEVLSTSAVGDLGNAIKLIGDRLSGFNRKFEARDKIKADIAKELDKVEKKMAKEEKDMNAEQKQQAQAAIRSARVVGEIADNPVSDYARYLVTTLAVVVSWAEKSLSLHKES